MELRMFGPVEAWADGEQLDIGPAKWRSVLAALAIAPGQVVSLDVLVERVWGDDPPGNPTATLYPYITRLRRKLEPAGVGIVSRSGGYLCDVPPECVDVVRFRQRVGEARELAEQPQPDRSAVTALLGEALATWRGTPLADLSGEWVTRTRDTLDRERLAALVLLAESHSYAGRLADLADDLLAASAEYPLSEPLAGFLIRALAASGRRAEALDYYAGLRELLVEQFGEEPGEELQDLHVRLLRRDPELTEPTRQASSTGPSRVVPRQLPVVARHFVGRDGELTALDELTQADRDTSTVVISAISGTAGIGKTAIAVFWAHRSAERFPDGQLYVNLRGFDPVSAPMAPADAVRGFLDGLGVRPEDIPQGLDAQTALYRSLIADRRLLVVLDNARDVDQVRPLLPGGSGCLTLVTSRNRLIGLVAEHGAHPITLDLLETAEAEQLLARQVGSDRVAAEPDAVAALLDHCARLPLALTIAAAQAALDPLLPLGKLAAELADARERLDTLDTEDPLTTVRAVFSWSYSAQDADVQRLFRLLGLHPGPDISAPAAASLAAVSVLEAAGLLDELCQVNLITEHTPGRYTFHDLLRAYAGELAETHDTEAEQRAAMHRMFDHYVHTAHAAGLLLNPHRDPLDMAAAEPGVVPEKLSDFEDARTWLTTEHAVLLAAHSRAAGSGFESHTMQLTWALVEYLHRAGHWQDRVAVQYTTLDVASRVGDRVGQARAHLGIGRSLTWLNRLEEAHSQLREALDLFTGLGDRTGQAHTHHALGRVFELQGSYEAALCHAIRTLELHQASEHRTGEANALNSIGRYQAQLGHYDQALTYCQRALELVRQLGDRPGEADAWDGLGYAHQHLGNQDRAVVCYQRALDLFQQLGDRYRETETLVWLGETHDVAGDTEAARATWQAALEILEELGHPDAAPVRAKLAT